MWTSPMTNTSPSFDGGAPQQEGDTIVAAAYGMKETSRSPWLAREQSRENNNDLGWDEEVAAAMPVATWEARPLYSLPWNRLASCLFFCIPRPGVFRRREEDSSSPSKNSVSETLASGTTVTTATDAKDAAIWLSSPSSHLRKGELPEAQQMGLPPLRMPGKPYAMQQVSPRDLTSLKTTQRRGSGNSCHSGLVSTNSSGSVVFVGGSKGEDLDASCGSLASSRPSSLLNRPEVKRQISVTSVTSVQSASSCGSFHRRTQQDFFEFSWNKDIPRQVQHMAQQQKQPPVAELRRGHHNKHHRRKSEIPMMVVCGEAQVSNPALFTNHPTDGLGRATSCPLVWDPNLQSDFPSSHSPVEEWKMNWLQASAPVVISPLPETPTTAQMWSCSASSLSSSSYSSPERMIGKKKKTKKKKKSTTTPRGMMPPPLPPRHSRLHQPQQQWLQHRPQKNHSQARRRRSTTSSSNLVSLLKCPMIEQPYTLSMHITFSGWVSFGGKLSTSRVAATNISGSHVMCTHRKRNNAFTDGYLIIGYQQGEDCGGRETSSKDAFLLIVKQMQREEDRFPVLHEVMRVPLGDPNLSVTSDEIVYHNRDDDDHYHRHEHYAGGRRQKGRKRRCILLKHQEKDMLWLSPLQCITGSSPDGAHKRLSWPPAAGKPNRSYSGSGDEHDLVMHMLFSIDAIIRESKMSRLAGMLCW